MSANAGAITFQTRRSMPRVWRSMVAVAVVAGAAVAGGYAGRATAPSAPIPAVAPHVQTGTITSTRPLSDGSFQSTDTAVRKAPVTPPDSPAGIHSQQLAR